MKVLLISVLACAGVGAAVVAASNGQSEMQEIAGHRFEVPKDHLFDMTIPWLPKSESDSFTFLFEPNPNPDAIPKHRVLVQHLSRLCPTVSTTDATQMLRVVCGQEAPRADERPPFVKVQNDLGSWSSDLYAVEKEPGEDGVRGRQKVAYCQLFGPNPAKSKETTLCTTFWAYKGMMLQFSFDEEESSEMPAMKERAMALLDQWEVH